MQEQTSFLDRIFLEEMPPNVKDWIRGVTDAARGSTAHQMLRNFGIERFREKEHYPGTTTSNLAEVDRDQTWFLSRNDLVRRYPWMSATKLLRPSPRGPYNAVSSLSHLATRTVPFSSNRPKHGETNVPPRETTPLPSQVSKTGKIARWEPPKIPVIPPKQNPSTMEIEQTVPSLDPRKRESLRRFVITEAAKKNISPEEWIRTNIIGDESDLSRTFDLEDVLPAEFQPPLESQHSRKSGSPSKTRTGTSLPPTQRPPPPPPWQIKSPLSSLSGEPSRTVWSPMVPFEEGGFMSHRPLQRGFGQRRPDEMSVTGSVRDPPKIPALEIGRGRETKTRKRPTARVIDFADILEDTGDFGDDVTRGVRYYGSNVNTPNEGSIVGRTLLDHTPSKLGRAPRKRKAVERTSLEATKEVDVDMAERVPSKGSLPFTVRSEKQQRQLVETQKQIA